MLYCVMPHFMPLVAFYTPPRKQKTRVTLGNIRKKPVHYEMD